MTMLNALTLTQRGKLLKIMALLGSDNDGERAAAALAAARHLAALGLEWPDVLVGGETRVKPPPGIGRDCHAEVRFVRSYAQGLSEWESNFLVALERCRCPTSRQMRSLRQIVTRTREQLRDAGRL